MYVAGSTCVEDQGVACGATSGAPAPSHCRAAVTRLLITQGGAVPSSSASIVRIAATASRVPLPGRRMRSATPTLDPVPTHLRLAPARTGSTRIVVLGESAKCPCGSDRDTVLAYG